MKNELGKKAPREKPSGGGGQDFLMILFGLGLFVFLKIIYDFSLSLIMTIRQYFFISVLPIFRYLLGAVAILLLVVFLFLCVVFIFEYHQEYKGKRFYWRHLFTKLCNSLSKNFIVLLIILPIFYINSWTSVVKVPVDLLISGSIVCIVNTFEFTKYATNSISKIYKLTFIEGGELILEIDDLRQLRLSLQKKYDDFDEIKFYCVDKMIKAEDYLKRQKKNLNIRDFSEVLDNRKLKYDLILIKNYSEYIDKIELGMNSIYKAMDELDYYIEKLTADLKIIHIFSNKDLRRIKEEIRSLMDKYEVEKISKSSIYQNKASLRSVWERVNEVKGGGDG